jgi:hypothetical protein
MANIVRLDKVRSIYNGTIESVKSDDTALFLENGFVGVAGELVGREIRKFEKPADESAKLVLVYNSEINYDESTRTSYALEAFKGLDGNNASRAYHLEAGDIYSVSPEAIDAIGAKPVKGNYLVAQAGSHKLKEIASLDPATTYGFVAKVGEIEKFGTPTNVGQAGVIQRVMELVVVDIVKN